MGSTCQAKRFFVATDGNDQWSGTLDSPNADQTDGPFATLTRARNAIRQLKLAGALQRPVEVLVRGGTYELATPFHLSAGDSGSRQAPITYAAFPGEEPVLSGGRRITDWQPYRDNIVCAQFPEAANGRWWFRQLFCNGQRMRRARYPKFDPKDPLYGGWAYIDAAVPEGDKNPSAFSFEPPDRG